MVKVVPKEVLERIDASPFFGGAHAMNMPPLNAISDFTANYELHEAGEHTGFTTSDLARYALALRECVVDLLASGPIHDVNGVDERARVLLGE